jgi:hypothetical protein
MGRVFRSGRRFLQQLGHQRRLRFSLVGGAAPGCVPAQAPLSVRLRALRRTDNRSGPRLLTQYEGLLLAALDNDVPTSLTELLANVTGLRTFKYWDRGMEVERILI